MSPVIQSVAKKTRKADHSKEMLRMFVMQICVPYHCEVIGQNSWMPPERLIGRLPTNVGSRTQKLAQPVSYRPTRLG